MNAMTMSRGGLVPAAALCGVLLLPASGGAQVGAVGAAVGAGVADENAHTGSPILGESAVVLPERGWTGSAYGGMSFGNDVTVTGLPGGADFTFFQLLLGVFYAPLENLTVGALAFPVSRVEVESGGQSAEDSGFGDVALYGKYRFYESPDGLTSVAALAQVGLPTGESGFGNEGVSLFGGLAASRTLDGGSLHGGAGVGIPMDDADGDPYVSFSASGVLGLTERVGLSLELLGDVGDESIVSAGPGVRVRAADRLFLDGAVVLRLGSTFDEEAYDYGVILGVNFGG